MEIQPLLVYFLSRKVREDVTQQGLFCFCVISQAAVAMGYNKM